MDFVANFIRFPANAVFFVAATLSTVSIMVFSDKDEILIRSLYLKKYTANMLTNEFPEKRWTKRGVKGILHSYNRNFKSELDRYIYV